MTFSIELSPEIEARLHAQAQSEGLDILRYVQNLLQGQITAKSLTSAAPSGFQDLSPEEWVREYKPWAHSHDADDLPSLSDEAISRDSIYD